jgi:hypothetical protein
MGYLEGKLQRNEALLRAVGHLPQEEPPPEAEGKPDFDGGAREPAPPPSNPVQEHDNFLLKLLENAPRGGGGEW